MEKKTHMRLQKAALTGKFVEDDASILDKIPTEGVNSTPLHISALLGHVDFVKEIIHRKPELAQVSNSKGSLPLHLAAAKGHVAVVEELVKGDADICLAQDRDGLTPLHVAAANGRVEVLRALVLANPVAMLAPTQGGDSVFHLCVKHNHLKALKLLVESADDTVVNLKDFKDNTVLHLATAAKQIEMVECLVNSQKVNVNARNTSESTALDMLLESRYNQADEKLKLILERARARGTKGMHVGKCYEWRRSTRRNHRVWLIKTKNMMMFVATLIATETYQAGISPPGGFWQDMALNQTSAADVDVYSKAEKFHIAGEAVMSYVYPKFYKIFMIFNSVGFLASVLLVVVLLSGLPIRRKTLAWIMTAVMWIAASSILVTYTCSVYVITSNKILSNPHWFNVYNLTLISVVPGTLLFMAGHFYFLHLKLPRLSRLSIKLPRWSLLLIKSSMQQPSEKKNPQLLNQENDTHNAMRTLSCPWNNAFL